MAEPTERYTACVSDEPLENIRRNEAEADFNLATSRFRRLFNELDKVTRERDEARAKHDVVFQTWGEVRPLPTKPLTMMPTGPGNGSARFGKVMER